MSTLPIQEALATIRRKPARTRTIQDDLANIRTQNQQLSLRYEPSPFGINLEAGGEEERRLQRAEETRAKARDIRARREHAEKVTGGPAGTTPYSVLIHDPVLRTPITMMERALIGILGVGEQPDPAALGAPERSMIENTLGWGSEMAGFIIGPGKVTTGLRVAGGKLAARTAARVALRSPMTAQAAEAIARATAITRLGKAGEWAAPHLQRMAQEGGSGAIYGFYRAVANHGDELATLYKQDPNKAVLTALKEAGVESAMWGVQAPIFHALIGGAVSLKDAAKRKLVERARLRAETGRAPTVAQDYLGPDYIPGIVISAKPRTPEEIAMRTGILSGGRPITRGEAPTREPVPSTRVASPARDVDPVRWTQGQLDFSLPADAPRTTPSESVQAFSEAASEAEIRAVANSRALGTNPRRIAALATERGITLEEARKLAIEEGLVRARTPGLGELAQKLVHGEQGAVFLDVLDGVLRKAPRKAVNAPGSSLLSLDAAIVAMRLDPQYKGDKGRILARVGKYVNERAGRAGVWEAAGPQVHEKAWNDASETYERYLTEMLLSDKGSVIRQFGEAVRRGQPLSQWYKRLKPAYKAMDLGLTDDEIEKFAVIHALVSAHASGDGAVSLASKAMVQHMWGKPVKGLYLGTKNVQKFLENPTLFLNDPVVRIGGNKISAFATGIRNRITDQERGWIAEGIMKGEPRFAAAENNPTIDMWHGRMRALTPEQVAKMSTKELERYDQIDETVRNVEQERYRIRAAQLTRERWAAINAQYMEEYVTNAPVAVLFNERITPRELHATDWVYFIGKVNEARKKLGKTTWTPQDYATILEADPAMQNYIRLMARHDPVAPPGWRTIEEIEAYRKSGQQFAIIGTDHGNRPLPKGALREGEDAQMAIGRELTSRFDTTQVGRVQGRWIEDGDVLAEESFLLANGAADNIPMVRALAQKYRQLAIMTREGEVNIETGQIRRYKGDPIIGPAAAELPHTRLIGADGNPLLFHWPLADPVPGDIHPAWLTGQQKSKILSGIQKLLFEEGGFARLDFSMDPASGRLMSPNKPIPPVLTPHVQQLERQASIDRLRHQLATGKPLTAGTAQLKVHPNGTVEKVSVGDMLAEAGAAFKVSGVVSNERNIFGNATSLVFRLGERLLAPSADFLLSGGGRFRARERFIGELTSDVVGMLASMKPALRNAMDALLHEQRYAQLGEQDIHGMAIKGLAGQIVRLPFRPLQAMDSVFSELNRGGIVRANAFRQAMKEGVADVPTRAAEIALNPSEEFKKQVAKEVDYWLFRGNGGKMLNAAYAVRRELGPVGRILFPFLRVTSNLMSFTAQRVPGLGLLIDRNADASDRLARQAMGAVLATGLVAWAMEGNITGAGPTSKSLRDAAMMNGWQPESIRVGGKWVSYRGFEPLATFMRMAGNFAEQYHSDNELTEKADAFITSVSKGFLDNNFMTQFRDMVDAFTGRDGSVVEGVGSAATNLVRGYIPTIVKEIGRSIDPTQRRASGLVEGIKSDLPYMRETVPAALNKYGEPITREGSAFLPRVSTPKDDPVLNEIVRLGVKMPGVNPRKRDDSGKMVERSQDELHLLATERGRQYRDILLRLVTSDTWASATDEQKKRTLERYIARIAHRTSRVPKAGE